MVELGTRRALGGGVLPVSRLAAPREHGNLSRRKGFASPASPPLAPTQNVELAKHVQPVGRKNVGEGEEQMTEADVQVSAWVQRVIEAGHAAGPVPRFGSPEWAQLPPSDARSFAAVVLAAECWRDHCSAPRVAEDLADQLDYEDWQVRARLAEASHDVSEAWAEGGLADRGPSFAELQQRRRYAGTAA